MSELEDIVSSVIASDDFLKTVQELNLTSSLSHDHNRDAHVSYLQAAVDVSTSSLDDDHVLKDRETFVAAYSAAFGVDHDVLWRDISDPGNVKDRHINRWIYHSFMDFALGVSSVGDSEKFYRTVSGKCFSEEARNLLIKVAKVSTTNFVLGLIGTTTNNYTTLTPVESVTLPAKGGKRRTLLKRYTIQEHVDELVDIFGRKVAEKKLTDNLIFTEEAYQTLRRDIFGFNDTDSTITYVPEQSSNGLIDKGVFEFTYKSGKIAQLIDWVNGWNPWKLRRINDTNSKMLFSYSGEIKKKEGLIEAATERRVQLEGEVALAQERALTAIAQGEADKAEQAYQDQITSTTERFGELAHIGHDDKHHLRTLTVRRKGLLELLLKASDFEVTQAITGPTGYIAAGLEALSNNEDAPAYLRVVAAHISETETYIEELRENSVLVMGGGFTRKDEAVSLKSLIDKAAKAVQTKYNVEVKYDIDETINIQGDPKQLSTCFANIFNNSGEVSVGGYIEVSVRQKTPTKGDVITAIQMQQSGYMPEFVAEKLNKHERFSTKDDGEGLGSQAIYRILENHSGSISYSASQVDDGPAGIRVLLR